MGAVVRILVIAVSIYYAVWDDSRWALTMLLVYLWLQSELCQAVLGRIRRYIASQDGYDIFAKRGSIKKSG